MDPSGFSLDVDIPVDILIGTQPLDGVVNAFVREGDEDSDNAEPDISQYKRK